jgi:hypothetical protein
MKLVTLWNVFSSHLDQLLAHAVRIAAAPPVSCEARWRVASSVPGSEEGKPGLQRQFAK